MYLRGGPAVALFLFLTGAVISGCASAGNIASANLVQPAYAALVDASHTGVDGAPVDGVRTYRTIGAALDAAPAENPTPFAIFIRNGRYSEKLTVHKPGIRFVGESRDATVLTHATAAGHPRPDGGTWGTRGSFTLRIAAPRFRLENMTVENSFDYPTEAARPADDPLRIQGLQAVAVLIDGASDQAVFENCRLSGYQDTLFADAGRQYFHRCVVLGNVDFIFGAGQAVFEDCDIISRDRGSTTNNGYIAAPSTLKSQPYGFLFIDSRLKKEHRGMAANSVSLGRPWRPSGNPLSAGSAIFVNVHMDDHISGQGWSEMGGFPPEEARLFEFGSTGPGAIASPSRRVLSASEAPYYTVEQVLRGWDPRVAYTPDRNS
jgi:pectinesterase